MNEGGSENSALSAWVPGPTLLLQSTQVDVSGVRKGDDDEPEPVSNGVDANVNVRVPTRSRCTYPNPRA